MYFNHPKIRMVYIILLFAIFTLLTVVIADDIVCYDEGRCCGRVRLQNLSWPLVVSSHDALGSFIERLSDVIPADGSSFNLYLSPALSQSCDGFGSRPGIIVTHRDSTVLESWASKIEKEGLLASSLRDRHLFLQEQMPQEVNSIPEWLSSINGNHKLVYSIDESGVQPLILNVIKDTQQLLLKSTEVSGLTDIYHLKISVKRNDSSEDTVHVSLDIWGEYNTSDRTKRQFDEFIRVNVIKREITGTGQHRKLETELYVSLPDNQKLSCHVSVVDILPPELFVDSDEVNHLNFVENKQGHIRAPEGAVYRIPLSFMNIELPAYMAHSTAVLHKQEFQGSQFLRLSLPVHVRYGAPCPLESEDQSLYTRSTCTTIDGSMYRTFILQRPVVFAECQEKSEKEFKGKYPTVLMWDEDGRVRTSLSLRTSAFWRTRVHTNFGTQAIGISVMMTEDLERW